MLILPAVFIASVFFLAPLLQEAWMSVHDWPLLGTPVYNGFANYRAIPDNELFSHAIGYTLLWTVLSTIVLGAVAGLLAWQVYRPRPGVLVYRTIYFLPYVTGLASSALLWYLMVNPQIGIFPHLLQVLHLTRQPVQLLGSSAGATFTVIALNTWKFAGFQMMVLIVGLQAIPIEIYEAAAVDGARGWRLFRRITLPLMRPTLGLLLILQITGALLAFDQFFVLTKGGPDNTTLTAIFGVYREAFVLQNLGAASALALVILVALVLLNLIQVRLIHRSDA